MRYFHSIKFLSICIIIPVIFIYCSSVEKNKKQSQGGNSSQVSGNPLVDTVTDVPETDIPLIDFSGRKGELPVSSFNEIWAYVLSERESALIKNMPLSDIAYFGAEVDSFGKLTDIPNRKKINYKGRVHLVAVCHSRSLNHFILKQGSPERSALIADLIAASKDYDGLQINFESISSRDSAEFASFLKELHENLGNKILSAAIPSRTRKLSEDAYDYERIKPYLDRILVMAYDEHWSGSDPGSVASLKWCADVANYSIKTIGREKLIMGLPFYGRAWGDQSTSRALIYSTVENVIKDNKVTEIKRENGIPTFDYKVNVSIKVYYEDDYSLSKRMEMYKSLNVAAIGFWRLGQETREVWKYMKLENVK